MRVPESPRSRGASRTWTLIAVPRATFMAHLDNDIINVAVRREPHLARVAA